MQSDRLQSVLVPCLAVKGNQPSLEAALNDYFYMAFNALNNDRSCKAGIKRKKKRASRNT